MWVPISSDGKISKRSGIQTPDTCVERELGCHLVAAKNKKFNHFFIWQFSEVMVICTLIDTLNPYN